MLRVSDRPGRDEIDAVVERLTEALASAELAGHVWVVDAGRLRQNQPPDSSGGGHFFGCRGGTGRRRRLSVGVGRPSPASERSGHRGLRRWRRRGTGCVLVAEGRRR